MKTYTIFVNCAEETVSTGILAECKDAQEIELLGRYEHPEHAGSNDWSIGLYTITTAEGYTIRAMSTNGDPVWEEEDASAFAEMLEEYLAEGEYTYDTGNGEEGFVLVRKIGQEDEWFSFTPSGRTATTRPDDLDGDFYGAFGFHGYIAH